VTNTTNDWSPADNPYAIAVSQAQWWRDAARLSILRMRGDDDLRLSWFSSRQIDARQLIFALRQLLAAEALERIALEDIAINPGVLDALAKARQQFVDDLPGIKEMRDGIMHFESWSRGLGMYGPQAEGRRKGELPRNLARDYWRFGYDPGAATISFGPYIIHIDVAERAAYELCDAICLAAREVDRRTLSELRQELIDSLQAAHVPYGQTDPVLIISPGTDRRIWLSLDLTAMPDEHERQGLATRVVAAAASAGLHLASTIQAETPLPAERLARGESLFVRRGVSDAELASAIC
jgi:hypothetical protein